MKIAWETIYRTLTVTLPKLDLPSPTIYRYESGDVRVVVHKGPFARQEIDFPKYVPSGSLSSLPVDIQTRQFNGGYLYTSVLVLTETDDGPAGFPADLSGSSEQAAKATEPVVTALALQVDSNLFDEEVYRGWEVEGSSGPGPAPVPTLAKVPSESIATKFSLAHEALDAITAEDIEPPARLASRWYLRALSEPLADSIRQALDLWVALEILVKPNLTSKQLARYLRRHVLRDVEIETVLDRLMLKRVEQMRHDIVHRGIVSMSGEHAALVELLRQIVEECLRVSLGFRPSGVLRDRLVAG